MSENFVVGSVAIQECENTMQNLLPQDPFYIQNLSVVNVRGVKCMLTEKIKFCCTMCGKEKSLGRGTDILMRINFVIGEEYLCDRCTDIMVDVIRHGPEAVSNAHKWKLSSKMMRVSVVHEYLMCFKCLQKRESHFFAKYDDLRAHAAMNGGWCAKKKKDSTAAVFRCCSQCAYTYMMMAKQAKMHEEQLKYLC
jgi:uncharacterized CHY-type Zn-finger protein